MRAKVPFTDVALIEEIRPDGSNLFPNIGIAEGEARPEKIAHALQTLVNVPEIDTVMIFADQDQPEVPVDALRRLSLGRRIKIDTNPEHILQDPIWVRQDVHRYLSTRMSQIGAEENARAAQQGLSYSVKGVYCPPNPYMDGYNMQYGKNTLLINGAENERALDCDIQSLAGYYAGLAADIGRSTKARLVRSSLSYSPNYGSSVDDGGYINCHIDDEPSFDARLIHVSMGSGTVLFDARDFEIHRGVRNGLEVYHPVLLRDNITCLTIPVGSSVIIREPSRAMLSGGRMPSIHSHGIGREDGRPEERLVERHDLELF